jgi:hypothetical protein
MNINSNGIHGIRPRCPGPHFSSASGRGVHMRLKKQILCFAVAPDSDTGPERHIAGQVKADP